MVGRKLLESRASCLCRVGGWVISLRARVEGGKPEETMVRHYCLGVDGEATEDTQAREPVENDSLRSENADLK